MQRSLAWTSFVAVAIFAACGNNGNFGGDGGDDAGDVTLSDAPDRNLESHAENRWPRSTRNRAISTFVKSISKEEDGRYKVVLQAMECLPSVTLYGPALQ